MHAKLLVVDDSPIVLKIVERALTRRGHTVVTARSGEEALQTFAGDKFALVILDVSLPGVDGYRVAEQIRRQEEEQYLPILFLSANTEHASRIQGLQHGGAVYMTKPFHEEEFIAQVESLLKIKELQDKLSEKNRLLEDLVKRDSLTGLYNHSYFQEIADHEFRRSLRYEHDLSCVLVDLDDFKRINDTFGHPTGDRVLAELAGLLIKGVRDVDVVARYGGEEFAILLPMTQVRNAKSVCERIRGAANGCVFDASQRRLHVSLSMGIASLRAHRPAGSLQLIELADEALYAAKRNGKNRVYINVDGDNNDLAQAALDRSETA